MQINSLERSHLKEKLNSDPGLLFQMGPFNVSVHSQCKHVIDGIFNLYGNYPLVTEEEFIDYKVSVFSPLNLHKIVNHPQALFSLGHFIPFKPLPLDQAYPMLEWGLNWCISSNAHEYLIIHSAVVAKNGIGMILPAPPGSGKSTLCAGLVSKGWQLLSDELALICCKTGNLIPIPRPISLKNQSIPVIKEFSKNVFINRASKDTAKGTVAHMKVPEQSIHDSNVSIIPALIVLPKYEAGSSTQLKPMTKATSFMKIAENSFNYSLLHAEGFKVTTRLINNCEGYTLKYSDLNDVVPALDYLIEQVSF